MFRQLVRGVREILVVILFVVAVRTIVAAPFYVPSASMEPTLQIGDELLTVKYPYGFSRYSLPLDPGSWFSGRIFGKLPARGDIVVFKLPRDPSETLVKRVIGLPGDRIQMRSGRLWINDAELPVRNDGMGQVEADSGSRDLAARYVETLPNGLQHPIFKLYEEGPLDDTPVFVVPPDHLFMMGDDRDNSLDSRVPASEGGVGFVPAENLIGRVDWVIGSWDFPVALQDALWRWPVQIRWERFFMRTT